MCVSAPGGAAAPGSITAGVKLQEEDWEAERFTGKNAFQDFPWTFLNVSNMTERKGDKQYALKVQMFFCEGALSKHSFF